MHVVVSEFIDEVALSDFGDDISVNYEPSLVDDRAGLFAALANADAVIVRNRTQVNQDMLDAAPRLRVVGRLGVGLDNIDLEACKSRDIAVLPATGANTLSVVEYVIGAALTLVRGAYFSNAAMIAGDWPRGTLGNGGEVSGRLMGLVGFGAIAQAVAERAKNLGMKVAAYDPFLPSDHPAWSGVESCSVENLLEKADVVSVHVPLTKDTANMIDADAISRMKRGAVLINTARGGIVDEAALAEALKAGQLGGAALDVFATEPLTAEAGKVFAGVPNLILTPHIAGVTNEGNTRVSLMTVSNVAEALAKG